MRPAGELTNNFLKRFQDLGAFLRSTKDVTIEVFNTFPPVSQEEIEEVEQKLKIKLDETFLAYFKESNGYELQYALDYVEGAIRIPGLKEIFEYKMEADSGPGELENETLGGRDDHEMRINMYCFDRYDEWRDESRYYAVYYIATDNVLLLSNDYDACITDAHPITVPSYFELCLATAGLVSRREMLERGSEGNYKIIDFSIKMYEVLYPWSKTLAYAKAEKVSPEFYELTALATENKGYELQNMQVVNDLQY